LDKKTLISGSGDGKIILWDFRQGEILYSFSCDENLENSNCLLDKKEKSRFPIKSIASNQSVASFVAVSFYEKPIIYLFKVTRNSTNITSSLDLVHKLSLEIEPI